MSLLTILRPATVQDCQAIHNAHLHAAQFACIRSYDENVLQAWEALLDTESYRHTIDDPDKALWVVEYKGRVGASCRIEFFKTLCLAQFRSVLPHQPL